MRSEYRSNLRTEYRIKLRVVSKGVTGLGSAGLTEHNEYRNNWAKGVQG